VRDRQDSANPLAFRTCRTKLAAEGNKHRQEGKEVAMPVQELKRFLDGKEVKYVSIRHSPAYTAQEIASSAHVSGRDLAKTVMIKAGGKMSMAVLPANRKIDFDRLEEILGMPVDLAEEEEFKDRFPHCQVGAMPPFGNLYGMDVVVDDTLTDEAQIAFNAGSFSELIQLAYADFARLVEPRVASFCLPPAN
jgi:Ala-tRNA(Pro) deacylase